LDNLARLAGRRALSLVGVMPVLYHITCRMGPFDTLFLLKGGGRLTSLWSRRGRHDGFRCWQALSIGPTVELHRQSSQAMFIPRMWFDEVERIGKQRCTPIGYALQVFGELVGFFGLLILLGMPVYLACRGVVGTFNWSLLWLLTVPFVMGIVGSIIVSFSWS